MRMCIWLNHWGYHSAPILIGLAVVALSFPVAWRLCLLLDLFFDGKRSESVRNSLCAVLIGFLGFAACNYTDGECYLRGQGYGSEGVGGGVSGPIGVGGFGETPPDPPNAVEAPDCNITSQSPCNEKCLADYESAALQCGQIQSSAQRQICQDDAHASYTSCRENCEQSANGACDDKYQSCINNGPTSCLKTSGGKTLCQRCWERCNAGDFPSGACRKCLF